MKQLTNKTVKQNHPKLPDFALCVLTQGFVYSGRPRIEGDYLIITEAKNVRQSGTERGFGQLALEGPSSSTTLDPCPDVIVPLAAVVHIMTCSCKPF
jgi:hypothetical protein